MNDSSLIPDEYVADRLEIRRTVIGVILFVIVMIGVVGAFFVTNRQWDSVRVRQAEVKIRYEDVSAKIARMEELRVARDDLVKRAELASALVSHVPRSYLLAGLIERMPPRVSWTSLKLTSREIVEADPEKGAESARLRPRGPAAAPVRTRGRKAVGRDDVDLEPKRYRTSVVLVGMAPDEVDVSMYVAALQEFDLLRMVMPDSTEVVDVDDVPMRKFKITMEIDARVEDSFEVKRVGEGDYQASAPMVTDRMVDATEGEEN